MRSEKEMMDLVLSLAEQDERIRIVTLEGSRANINIPKDEFQDYDITYFVSDIEPFISNDDWLNQFGNIIMMQKPEDMELFPAEEKGYSYIILFDDYNKIDLTLLPLEELGNYLNDDKLIKIILDKDGRIQQAVVPTDMDYHIRKPSAREYDDCCNEFWNTTTYVVKGLCLVLVYKCRQKKLNSLYYKKKEQRRCSTWRKIKNRILRNSSSRSSISTMPEVPHILNWNMNMA